MTRRAWLTSTATALAVAPFSRLAAGELPRKRKVAVTIDDGPAVGTGSDLAACERVSKGIREAFVAEKVPAIMFVNERQLNVDGQRDARVATLQAWLDAGLDLGNHTYSHPNLQNISVADFLDDIIKGEVVTRPLLESRGRKLVWFRYPFLATGTGETAKTVEDFLGQHGYRIAPVTVDSQDYTFAGTYAQQLRTGNRAKADELFATALDTMENGFERAEKRSMEVLGYELPQTLLIHCNEMNAIGLRSSLQRIRKRGYMFVSLEEAMTDAAYRTPGLPPGTLGGGGLLNRIAAEKRGRR